MLQEKNGLVNDLNCKIEHLKLIVDQLINSLHILFQTTVQKKEQQILQISLNKQICRHLITQSIQTVKKKFQLKEEMNHYLIRILLIFIQAKNFILLLLAFLHIYLFYYQLFDQQMKRGKTYNKNREAERITQKKAESMQSSSHPQSHNVEYESDNQSAEESGIQKFQNYNEIFQLRSSINDLTLQNDSLRYQYSNLVEAYKQLQRIHLECLSQNNNLKQTLDNVKEDNQILINQTQSIKNAMSKLSNINNISQQFQEELQKKDNLIQELSNQVKGLMNKINKQNSQSQKSENRRSDIQNLQSDIQRLKKDLIVSKEHYEKMLEQKDQIIKGFSQQNESHYKNILQNKNKTIQSLEDQLKSMKNSLQKYQQEYHRQKQYRQALQNQMHTKINQIKIKVDENISLQKQNRQSQKNRQGSNAEELMQEYERQVQQREKQLEKSRQIQQSLVQQLHSTNQQVNRNKSQICSLQQYNQYLQKYNSQLQAKKKDIENQLYQRQKQLGQVKDQNFRQVLEYKKQIVSLKKKVDESNENNRQRQRENKSISSANAISQSKFKETQERLEQVEHNLQNFRLKYQSLESEKIQLIRVNTELQIQISSLKQKTPSGHTQNSQAYRHSYPDSSYLKRQNLGLKQGVNKLEAKLEQKNQKMNKLQSKLRQEYKSRIQSLEKHIYQLETKNNKSSTQQMLNKMIQDQNIEQINLSNQDQNIEKQSKNSKEVQLSPQNSQKSKSIKQTNANIIVGYQKNQLQNIQSQLNNFGEVLTEKQKQIKVQTQEIQRLQTIIEILKLEKGQKDDKIAKLKKQLQQKESAVFQKDLKLTQNNRKINQLEQDNRNYESIHDQINDRYRKGIQSFKAQIKSMNEELGQQKNTFQTKKRQMRKIEQELAFKISQLSDQSYSMQNKLKKQEIQIITLQGQLRQAEQQQIQSVVISRTTLVNYKNTQIRLQELQGQIKKLVKQKNQIISQKRTLEEYYQEQASLIKSNNYSQRQKLIRRLTQTEEIKGDYEIKLKKIHQLLQQKRKQYSTMELTCEKLSKQNYCIKLELSEALSEVNSVLLKNRTVMSKYEELSNKYDQIHLVYDNLSKCKNNWQKNNSQAQGIKAQLSMAYQQIDSLNRVLMQKERQIKYYLNQPTRQFSNTKQYRNQAQKNKDKYNFRDQERQDEWQSQSEFTLNQNSYKNTRFQTADYSVNANNGKQEFEKATNYSHYRNRGIDIDAIYPTNKTYKQTYAKPYSNSKNIAHQHQQSTYFVNNGGNSMNMRSFQANKKSKSDFSQNKMVGGFPIQYCTFAPTFHKI